MRRGLSRFSKGRRSLRRYVLFFRKGFCCVLLADYVCSMYYSQQSTPSHNHPTMSPCALDCYRDSYGVPTIFSLVQLVMEFERVDLIHNFHVLYPRLHACRIWAGSTPLFGFVHALHPEESTQQPFTSEPSGSRSPIS